MALQFAYLQLYSRWSGFSGLSELDTLVNRLWEVSTEEGKAVAAALTDTFSLAAYPELAQRLADNGVRPLAGAEVALDIDGVPYGLLLLAYSREGYGNLCRIISAGLTNAGTKPLLASVTLEVLQERHYYGGVVMSALANGKSGEAKNRATALRDIFGENDFYLAVPPILPTPDDDPKLVKQNAALVKLSRDLKIGLVATGETRYLYPDDARAYQNLRNRLQRALSEQMPPALVKQPQLSKQDWFYSFQQRPMYGLHLRTPAELVRLYADGDYSSALINNLKIAGRCASWSFEVSDSVAWLREHCLQNLPHRYAPEEQDAAKLRLESELADIADLGLADAISAAYIIEAGLSYDRIALPRNWSNSVLAYLAAITHIKADLKKPPADFSMFAGGQPIRVEIAKDGRKYIERCLNKWQPETLIVLPIAVAASDAELTPIEHPRKLLVSLSAEPASLADITPIVQAVNLEGHLTPSAQVGAVLPPGTAILDVVESKAVTVLQTAYEIGVQNTAIREGIVKLKRSQDVTSTYLEAGSLERAIILTRLDWFKTYHPAVYYAAMLTLAVGKPEQLKKLAESARLNDLAILPPHLKESEYNFTVEEADKIRTGLNTVIDNELATYLGELSWNVTDLDETGEDFQKPFENLNHLLQYISLNAEQIEKLAWSGALDVFGRRETLAANAAKLEAVNRAWQEWKAQEADATGETDEKAPTATNSPQMSLFDLFADVPAEEKPRLERPAPVVLEEAPPLSKLELLRKQYEVLGFFTAEHPLWGETVSHNADASRTNPVALGSIAELPPETGTLIALGMVTGVRRVPIAMSEGSGAGEELTVLQIEDFTGKAEILVPKDTPAEGVAPEEGSIIAVQARRMPKSETHPDRIVLAALALAPYPPADGRPLFPADNDLPETVLDELPPDDLPLPGENSVAAPEASSPEPNGAEWSASLFDAVGAAQPATPTKAEAALAAAMNLNQPQPQQERQGGRGGKGKTSAPPRVRRVVHLTLPLTETEDEEDRILNGLKKVLTKYPGDVSVMLYLPLGDGNYQALEVQGIEIEYTADFVAAAMHWIGTEGIRLEEKVY
jgi:hypothetical protein